MQQIVHQDLHPYKKRYILGPVARLILRVNNWDIKGSLPKTNKIVLASGPHSSLADSWYFFISTFALDLRTNFLGSINMFTRISFPSSTKEDMNLDNYGIRHPFWWIQRYIINRLGGIPVWREKAKGTTQQIVERLKNKSRFILYITVEGNPLTNGDIKTRYYFIAKELDATVVPMKIDFGNRRYEILEPLSSNLSVEDSKRKLEETFHNVKGKKKTFIAPGLDK